MKLLQYSSLTKSDLAYFLLALLSLVAGFAFFSFQNYHHDYTVIFYYVDAAKNWLQQRNLYNGTGYGFIYLPQAAILFIPFSFFHSQFVTEIVWRAFWLVLSAIALYQLAQKSSKPNQAAYYFFLIFVFLAFSADTLRNGQMNIEMMTLSLFAFNAIEKKQLWLAAFLLTLALALKTTFIVLFLLCFALYPNLRIKLCFFILLMLVFPFLTAQPQYVIHQYQDALSNLVTSSAYSSVTTTHYQEFAQFFTMLYVFHIVIPFKIQTLIRLGTSLIALGVSWFITQTKHIRQHHQHMLIYSIAMIYLLLFNPRTENNDYMLLAPAFAWFCHILYLNKQVKQQCIQYFLMIFIIFHHDISQFLLPPFTIWIAPLATLCWTATLIYYFRNLCNAKTSN